LKPARAYGDRSFAASPEALWREVMEELEEVAGWTFVIWVLELSLPPRIPKPA
jgi:hypothetical protein